jgi:hypothetical protein
MPELARFYGMIIKMYFVQKEHNPPHIHAIYGEYMSAIDIKTLEVLEGDLPDKALSLVREWITLYQNDIMEIWKSQQFKKIPPLQ